jgi:serine/threonine protein kinase
VGEGASGAGASGAGAAHYSKLASFLEFCSGMKVLAKPPSFSSVTRDVYPATPGAIQGLTVAQAGVVALAVASAAAHLHAAGVAHGDLYGHNLLLDPALVGPAAAGSTLAALAGRVKLGDLGAAFFYEAGSARGALVERVEVRAWACLAEELLALAGPAAAGSAAGSAASALGAALGGLSKACGAEGGSVAERPSFAEIVGALSGPVRAAVEAASA